MTSQLAKLPARRAAVRKLSFPKFTGRNLLAALLTLLAAILLVLLFAFPVANAAGAPTQVIDLKVSHFGINGQANPLVQVEEGSMVELHLHYDDMDLPEDNPHQLTLVGSDIDAPVIDRAHPDAVMKFRAGNLGSTMQVACKLSCSGHDNVKVTLRIVPVGAAGGAPVVASATKLTLATKPPASPDGKAELKATVTDEKGTPLEGVDVGFAVRTTFIISDFMPIGKARTDASGVAVLQFKPNRSGDQTIRASYEGDGRNKPAEASFNLAAGEVRSNYVPTPGLSIPGFGFWILWTILGVIWALYVFIFVELHQIHARPNG